MLNLSTISAIIYSQTLLIFIALFIIWFFLNRNKKAVLKDTLLAHTKLKNEFDELQKKHETIKLELEAAAPDKDAIVKDIFDQELVNNRELIDTNFHEKETVHQAHIYEFRSVYLQLEKEWLLTDDKNSSYWKSIYGELNELLKQNTLLNKLHNENNNDEQEEPDSSHESELESIPEDDPPEPVTDPIAETDSSADIDIDDIINEGLDK